MTTLEKKVGKDSHHSFSKQGPKLHNNRRKRDPKIRELGIHNEFKIIILKFLRLLSGNLVALSEKLAEKFLTC